MKKLKIKFWKAEKALAMQIIEQEGLPETKEEGHALITDYPRMFYKHIYLRGTNSTFDYEPDFLTFDSNQERDEYLDKITQYITDEMFTGTGELKVGEMCEFSNDNEKWEVYRLITILREGLQRRYLANVGYNTKAWDCFEYARPLGKRTDPKVETNGEIVTYTWEEE